MLFPTPTFALFFTVVLAGHWLVAARPAARKVFLLTASLFFYGYWDIGFLPLLAGLVLGNFGAAWLVSRSRRQSVRKGLLTTAIAADLGVLAVFKYYGFFVTSATTALARLGLDVHPPLLQLVLPLGISFLTFEAIAYLVEVYRSATPVASLLDVAVWLCFFPTVTSGPIVRPTELFPQLAVPADSRHVEAPRALWLIGRGLVKKVVVASFLASVPVSEVFTDPGRFSAASVLLGVYVYAARIYVDFSGYTDMAIGIALLLGVRLPENFDAPYTASSIHDFWGRWHMSLSRWLRDFLFTPLVGLSRKHWWRSYWTPIVVMLLAGLWHGAAWTFVAFGAVHGVSLATERWMRERRRRHGRHVVVSPGRRVVGRVVAFHVVCLGWVFFASASLHEAWSVLGRIATGWGSGAVEASPLLVATVAGVIALQYVPRSWTAELRRGFAALAPLAQGAALAVFLLVVDLLSPAGVAPFIYYRF